jgi:hypothetical protein
MSKYDWMGRLLDENDSYIDINGNSMSGCCSYEGITVMQHPDVFKVLESMLMEIKPARILEIGTAAGGLTLFFRHCLDRIGLESSPIKTFDIYPSETHGLLNVFPTVSVSYENLFNKDYNQLIKPELVVDYIVSPGTTLVICDGGNKVTEFNQLSEYLKVGDYIMAHDYAESAEFFSNHIVNKIWCWMEINESNIIDSCEKYNLQPFMKEELQNIVWTCKKKV